MCGIAGFLGGINTNSDSVMRRMLTRIVHRGPDQSGIYISDQVALGSVRLSIIDLQSGTMPISSNDNNSWIVFNGEIFNYIELREDLLQKGYQFKTTSDTEVVVNLYQEYGNNFIPKLNGQFAIAIWNSEKEELLLARDRVGIRPLFYTTANEKFVFASEIKAMLEFPDINVKLCPKSISEYFTFWTSISPNTAFENIYELSPGTYMTIKKNELRSYRYWELPLYKPGEYTFTNIDEASKAFEKIFHDAVKLRLRADVPVAAYLSGGIDSSVTTSFIKNISPDNLKTYSIGFAEKEFDESFYQKIAADFFKTNHHNFSCTSQDIANEFKDVVWHSEVPLLRTAPTPMKLLSKSVKDDHTKVVITGEGADEILGGYNIFKEAKIRLFWSKDPNSKFRPMLLKRLYPYLPQFKNANSTVLKMFFGFKLNETSSPVYSHLLRWNNTSRINNFLSGRFKDSIGEYNPVKNLEDQLYKKFEGYDYLTKAQWIELSLFMSGYLLSSQGDRMAMANSVEGRYPFLDYRVIELCMSMHPDLKLKLLNEKYLLKILMNGKLPPEILNRSKQAYRAPIKSVFLSNSLPGELKAILSKEKIEEFDIFDYDKVDLLLKKMYTKNQFSEIDNMALTAIISTQLLYDQFVNKNIAELNEANLIQLDKIIDQRK
ncbi:MAG: asparagine synthase (glutamine-hydrolyzing) [Flavobacteriaceae bacterium]|nr:asparagine synthase (glutamine-hydrolyzing) [Flavobacteriaceae bacterium]